MTNPTSATIPEPGELQGRKQVRLRLRRNLVVVPQREAGRPAFVLKDPISLRYYQLDEGQRFVVSLMDGSRTLEEIRQEYEKAYRPERLPSEELEGFAAQLVNDGLAYNETPRAASLLYQQSQKQKGERRRERLLNFLCVKIPLFDPDRLLGRLRPWLGWLFTPAGYALGLCLLLVGGALVLSNWPAFVSKLPNRHEFFTPQTLLTLWLAYVVVKVLHEFGHGLCCRVQDGEVHEMGVMFLLFFPAAYCNVSDAWSFRGRWPRVAVSLAGVHVELLLAGIAALVWWASDPASLPCHVALSVMVVCTVHTLAVNANPLLRYDGYYALADWLEIPNLSEVGGRVLRYWVLSVLGLPAERDFLLGGRRCLFVGCHAALAFVYRWVALAGAFYALHLFLQPYRLGVLCLLAAVGAVGVGLVWPVCRLVALLVRQGRWQDVKRSRLGLALAGSALAVAVVVFVPIPQGVEGLAVIQAEPANSDRLSVPASGGFLDAVLVEDNQPVQKGQVLAVLSNPKLRVALSLNEADVGLRLQQEQAQVAWLTENRGADAGVSNDLEQTRFELLSLRKQRSPLEQQAKQLTLRAPRSGRVVGLPPRDQQGKWLEPGAEVCRVSDPDVLRAVLLVEPADRQRIQVGSRASFHPHGGACHALTGVLSEVALIDSRDVPPQLSSQAGGEVVTKPDPASGQARPQKQVYVVAVSFVRGDRTLHPGALGRLRVEAESRTLWWRLRRYLALTFNVGL